MEKGGGDAASPKRLRRTGPTFFNATAPVMQGSCKVGSLPTALASSFWAIGHKALASESKAVQVSPTIILAGLTLTGLTGARFAGSAGLFFDNGNKDLAQSRKGAKTQSFCHKRTQRARRLEFNFLAFAILCGNSFLVKHQPATTEILARH